MWWLPALIRKARDVVRDRIAQEAVDALVPQPVPPIRAIITEDLKNNDTPDINAHFITLLKLMIEDNDVKSYEVIEILNCMEEINKQGLQNWLNTIPVSDQEPPQRL